MVVRAVERLIVSVGGMTCIVLGFRLFAVVLSDKSSFEGSLSGARVKAQRVAPGLVFAAFGAVLLGISINRPIYFDGLTFAGLPPSVQQSGQLALTSSEIRSLSIALMVLEDQARRQDFDEFDTQVAIDSIERIRDSQLQEQFSISEIGKAKSHLISGEDPAEDETSVTIRNLLGFAE